ncbi:MAG TPA: flagellar motor switch protein FliN [Acidimicrobiia bacterium]|nr:flagellar motor switch protein FliN [Acidimicrobiia bacterium]
MSQFDEVLASPEWAFTVAAALEQQLGDDRILTVGTARESVADVLRDEPSRTVSVRFTTTDGESGTIALIAAAPFAEALERAASDEILLTACAAALEAAARTIGAQAVIEIETEAGHETDPEAAADEGGGAGLSVYPLLDGGDRLGCLVLRISSGEVAGAPSTASDTRTPVASGTNGGAAAGASYVLADVEMGVTAELGRCRMTVRELLSITPGAVIDLDRAAGAPVDVLVNGTLIARGEVVVIDEEFGIRISELIPQPAAAR